MDGRRHREPLFRSAHGGQRIVSSFSRNIQTQGLMIIALSAVLAASLWGQTSSTPPSSSIQQETSAPQTAPQSPSIQPENSAPQAASQSPSIQPENPTPQEIGRASCRERV